MYFSSSVLAVLLVTLSSQECQVSGSTFLVTAPTRNTSATTATDITTRTPHPHTISTHAINGNSFILGPVYHRALHSRPSFALSSKDDDDANNRAPLDVIDNDSDDKKYDADDNNTSVNSVTKEIDNAKSAIQTALFNRSPFATDEVKQSKKEIDSLIQKQKDRDTKINRLKFQLTEFKESLQESEVKKKEMQDDLDIFKQTKKIVDDEDGTNDIVKIMQEKKSLEKEIVSLTKQLASLQKNSAQELQDLQQQSTKEQKILQQDINDLKSELQTTSDEILKQQKTNESFFKKKGVAEDQIQSLNSHLAEVKEALLQREKELMELQEKIELNINKTKEMREMEAEEVDRIKLQFAVEKEELEGKVQLYQEEIERAETSQREELDVVKERGENEKSKLLSILAARQEELEVVKEQIDAAQDEVLQARQNANAKVKEQKAQSKRLQGVAKEIAAREKKELKKKIWGLETIAKSAQYNIVSVRKEANGMKASMAVFEKQIEDLEVANMEQIAELEERLKADEMFFAASKFAAKTRMQGLATAFQKRMLRRKDGAEKNVKDVRIVLKEEFDGERMVLGAEKVEAVEDMRLQGMDDLNAAQIEFDAKVVELNIQMNGAKEQARKQMNEMISDFDIELQNERIKAAEETEKTIAANDLEMTELNVQMNGAKEKARKEMDEIISNFNIELQNERVKAEEETEKAVAAKNLEMKRAEIEADRIYDGLKIDMTQRLDVSVAQNVGLRRVIDEKDETILSYEAEKSSFRQLGKLTWKLAKSKMKRRRLR